MELHIHWNFCTVEVGSSAVMRGHKATVKVKTRKRNRSTEETKHGQETKGNIKKKAYILKYLHRRERFVSSHGEVESATVKGENIHKVTSSGARNVPEEDACTW